MELLDALPLWALTFLIFALRIVDVSLGTLRTITTVRGRLEVSMMLGFIEVLIWVAVVSHVISRVDQQPVLILAYAAGFAAGNACGILLERRFAGGTCVIRMITGERAEALADQLRARGQAVTTFEGRGVDGNRTLLFTTCRRAEVASLVDLMKAVAPGLFYTVERFTHAEYAMPLPGPTGWRAVLKKK